MKVICKKGIISDWEWADMENPSDYLTLGKVYQLPSNTNMTFMDDVYVVICDDGVERLVPVDLFELVEVYRNNRIDEILGDE